MHRIRSIGKHWKRFLLTGLSGIGSALFPLMVSAATSPAAEKAAEKIAVFPSTSYDGYIIYESLAVFWLFIMGLLVVLRMKLREIERVQQLGVEEKDPNAPLLE